MIEPKVQDRPINCFGPWGTRNWNRAQKIVFWLGYGLGQQAKIVKSYNTGPKGVLGPGDLKRCGSGQNFNMDQIGDFEIIEPKFNLFYKCWKIRNTQNIRPNIFFLCLWCYEITCTCISHVIHKCPQYNAVACISHHRNMLGNKCYFMIGNQIINRIMWLV